MPGDQIGPTAIFAVRESDPGGPRDASIESRSPLGNVLEGVKVIEVASWAYVPSAGATLADWGADVVKIEPPTGDPIRGLVNAGLKEVDGFLFPWEAWNRGKRSVALDLSHPKGREILLRLVADAHVFLTNYLPPVRRKLQIDIGDIQAVSPNIVYGCGTATGAEGPEAEEGGFDLVTFWGRGGVAASLTAEDATIPVNMPSGGFGDSLSGMALAGGVAAALLRQARFGEGSVVVGSLLGTAMWSMQMAIVGAHVAGVSTDGGAARAPRPSNPLVRSYRTSDRRWVTLCMMQMDFYLAGFCRAIDREDLLTDPRFNSTALRIENEKLLIAELEQTFATRPLAAWTKALATQPGQWDIINGVADVLIDPQAVQNGFVQNVDYGRASPKPLISSPVQFDRKPPALRPAPEFGAHTDEVLLELGMDWDSIISAKISGAVV
jgi:crotonobetainyl-CoA:carnitine CoA-transferase CaiB-like acyl-CoA transferase